MPNEIKHDFIYLLYLKPVWKFPHKKATKRKEKRKEIPILSYRPIFPIKYNENGKSNSSFFIESRSQYQLCLHQCLSVEWNINIIQLLINSTSHWLSYLEPKIKIIYAYWSQFWCKRNCLWVGFFVGTIKIENLKKKFGNYNFGE